MANSINPTTYTPPAFNTYSDQNATVRDTTVQKTENGQATSSSNTAPNTANDPVTRTGNDISGQAVNDSSAPTTTTPSDTAEDAVTYSSTTSVDVGNKTSDPDVSFSGEFGETSAQITGVSATGSSTVISDKTATAAKNMFARVEKMAADVVGSSAKASSNHFERVELVQRAYKSLATQPGAQAKFKAAVLAEGAAYGLNFGFTGVESKPVDAEHAAVGLEALKDYNANKNNTSTTAPKKTAESSDASKVDKKDQTTGIASTKKLSDTTKDFLATMATYTPAQIRTMVNGAMQDANKTVFAVGILSRIGLSGAVNDDLRNQFRNIRTAEEAANKLIDLSRNPPEITLSSVNTSTNQTATA